MVSNFVAILLTMVLVDLLVSSRPPNQKQIASGLKLENLLAMLETHAVG